MEGLLVLLGIGVVLYLLISPILLIVVWNRTSRLEKDARDLRVRLATTIRDLRTGALGGVASASPQAGAGAKPVAEPPQVVFESITPPPPTRDAADDIWMPTERPKPPVRSQSDAIAAVAAARKRPDAPQTEESEEPAVAASSGISLEEILAGRWMTWVGALAVIIGIGFFFKYAIDNQWIGETGRVVLGLILGMGVFAGGAFAMLKDYKALSQGLVGAAMGILYFSLFAAFKWYELFGKDQNTIPFVGMILITASGLAFAAYFDALATAILALIGGFLTPMMLSTGVDAQVSLFTYILILDAGVLGVATFRQWRSLEILAFAGSIVMWLGWFGRFYAPEKLGTTLVLMTLYFVLFALLGIWHNVIRKLPAEPGDFFLMLATPVIYFIGLYTVTYDKYSDFHGLMAVALAAVYLVFGALALTRNPAGKNIVACMGGLAASFITIAVPLQLTGHWIAIAWAAESLLLVELGLHYRERKLRLAGFGLLMGVQFVLAYYGMATVANPERFDTRFTRPDPVAREFGPSGVPIATATRPAAAQAEKPSWTDVFNGRSLSFLASIVVLTVLAWEYKRRGMLPGSLGSGTTGSRPPWAEAPLDEEAPEEKLSPQTASVFLAAIPVLTLALLLVESYALGHSFRWLVPTFLGVFSFWTAVVGLIVVRAAVTTGPTWLKRIGVGVFGLGAGFLVISSLITLSNWRHEYPQAIRDSRITDDSMWRLLIANPRGFGFLAMIVATGLAALMVRDLRDKDDPDANGKSPMSASAIFGTFAYLTGLAMLTVEFYAQGVIRNWQTWTALNITFVWTAYAIATLIAGIFKRSQLVRVLALALFMLTTAKVFLYDVWILDKAIRTLAFVGLGVSLLLVSFLYRRFRDRIRAWIAPAAIVLAVTLAGASNPSTAFAQAADPEDARTLQSLKERWPVKIPAGAEPTGELRSIPLPPELYGVARWDLSDLRVFASDSAGANPREIPYVLVSPGDTSQVVPRNAPMLNLSQKGDSTEFLLDLSGAVNPVNELLVDVLDTEENYERPVKVYAANERDAAKWNLLTSSGYLMDVTRPGLHVRANKIEFPQSRFSFYLVSIANQGKPPLTITGARLFDRERVRAARKSFDAAIVSTERDEKTRQTRVVLDLTYPNLPTVALDVRIDYDGSFSRPATLEAADSLEDPVQWRTVVSGSVYRIDRPDFNAAQTSFQYGEVRGRYLRLSITDGDDQPLHVKSASASGIEKLVVLEQRELVKDDRPIALYAGNADLAAAQYDLARTIRLPNPPSAPSLEIGPQEQNPLYKGPFAPGRPWSEENKPLIWTLTIVGVVIFGGLTVLLLRSAAKSQAAPPP